jgi:hypothetical protein
MALLHTLIQRAKELVSGARHKSPQEATNKSVTAAIRVTHRRRHSRRRHAHLAAAHTSHRGTWQVMQLLLFGEAARATVGKQRGRCTLRDDRCAHLRALMGSNLRAIAIIQS